MSGQFAIDTPAASLDFPGGKSKFRQYQHPQICGKTGGVAAPRVLDILPTICIAVIPLLLQSLQAILRSQRAPGNHKHTHTHSIQSCKQELYLEGRLCQPRDAVHCSRARRAREAEYFREAVGSGICTRAASVACSLSLAGERLTRDHGATAPGLTARLGVVEWRCTSLTPQQFRNFVVRAGCFCEHGRDPFKRDRTQGPLPDSPAGACVEFMSVHHCISCCSGSPVGSSGAVVMFDAGGVTFLQLFVIHRSQNRRPWVAKVSLAFPQGKAPLDRSVTTCSVSALHRSEQCSTRFYIACMCLGCFFSSR